MMLDDCRLMHGLRVKCPMVDHGSEIEGGRHDDKSRADCRPGSQLQSARAIEIEDVEVRVVAIRTLWTRPCGALTEFR